MKLTVYLPDAATMQLNELVAEFQEKNGFSCKKSDVITSLILKTVKKKA